MIRLLSVVAVLSATCVSCRTTAPPYPAHSEQGIIQEDSVRPLGVLESSEVREAYAQMTARLVLHDGKSGVMAVKGRRLILTSDSVAWLDTVTGRREVADRDRVLEIRYVKRNHFRGMMKWGGLGAGLGGVLGLLIWYNSSQASGDFAAEQMALGSALVVGTPTALVGLIVGRKTYERFGHIQRVEISAYSKPLSCPAGFGAVTLRANW